MPSELFRPSALSKLSSPEQLDQLVTYADPKAWIALATLLGLLLLALLWGIFGSVPTRIEGQGILLGQGGVLDVAAPGTGTLQEWLPLKGGDQVQAGQPLGRIAQPLLEREIELAAARLAAGGAAEQRAALRERLALLQARLELSGRVLAPRAGRIVEIKTGVGERVTEGQALFSMEQGDQTLVAEVYLPPGSDIQQVRPGTLVRLSPNTTRREEDGFLLGRVSSVSEFPVSRQGMLARLGNASLVDWLAQDGAPFAVSVELPRDAHGRYQWSSRSGKEVGSGTLCAASVILREDAPITLMLPWLKRLLGEG